MEKILISKNEFTNLTMIATTKISSKGQIVIPQNIREILSLKTGSTCILRQVGKRIIIIPEKEFEKELLAIEKEQHQWHAILEKTLQKDWNNQKDEDIWRTYL